MSDLTDGLYDLDKIIEIIVDVMRLDEIKFMQAIFIYTREANQTTKTIQCQKSWESAKTTAYYNFNNSKIRPLELANRSARTGLFWSGSYIL